VIIYPKVPALLKEQKLQTKYTRDKLNEEAMSKLEDHEAELIYQQTYGNAIEVVQEPYSGFNQAEVVQEMTVIMKSIQERPRSNSKNRMIAKEDSFNKNLTLAPRIVTEKSNNEASIINQQVTARKTYTQTSSKDSNKPSSNKTQQEVRINDYRSRSRS
jgi:hypothetical protein